MFWGCRSANGSAAFPVVWLAQPVKLSVMLARVWNIKSCSWSHSRSQSFARNPEETRSRRPCWSSKGETWGFECCLYMVKHPSTSRSRLSSILYCIPADCKVRLFFSPSNIFHATRHRNSHVALSQVWKEEELVFLSLHASLSPYRRWELHGTTTAELFTLIIGLYVVWRCWGPGYSSA